MNNDDLFPKHEGGGGRLRAMLSGLGEKSDMLLQNPLYAEGFDDGYIMGRQEAEEEAKCLVRALTKLYDNDNE